MATSLGTPAAQRLDEAGRAVPGVLGEPAFQGALVVKNLPANAGHVRDVGSIPGSGRSSGRGHGNPLQYSCLENPMGRGAWQATVHGVTEESDTTEYTRSLLFNKEVLQILDSVH